MATETGTDTTGPYPLGAIYMSSQEVWLALGVRPDLLRQWATREHVLKVGRDLYDMASVMNHLERTGRRSKAS